MKLSFRDSSIDAAIIFFLILANLDSFAQGPTLDPAFGNGGIVKANLGYGPSNIEGSTIFHDDKIMIMTRTFPYNYSFDLQRLNADGTIDSTFGNGGKEIYPLSNGEDFVSFVKDSSDRLIFLGISTSNTGPGNLILMRLFEDGSIDSTFGVNGQQKFNFGSAFYDPEQIELTSNQNFMLVVRFSDAKDRIIKLLPNGLPDSSFGKNGFIEEESINANEPLSFIACQPDEKVLAVFSNDSLPTLIRLTKTGGLDSSFKFDLPENLKFLLPLNITLLKPLNNKIFLSLSYRVNDSIPQFTIIRLNENGSIDSTFANDGLIYSNPSSNVYLNYFSVQEGGKIISSENIYSSTSTIDTESFKKFTEDGLPDESFGQNGETILKNQVQTLLSDNILFKSTGDILGFGTAFENQTGNDAIVELKPNGTINNDFGIDGLRILPDGESDDYLEKLDFLSDKSILAEGYDYFLSYSSEIAKFDPDGQINLPFGNNGIVSGIPSGGNYSIIPREFFHLPDDKIELTGHHIDIDNGSPYDIFFSRILKDGKVDSTFGNNGLLLSSMPISGEFIMDEALQSDGKVLVNAVNGGKPSFICRFDSNGLLDPTFGKNDTVQEFQPNNYATDKLHIQQDGKIIVSNGGNDGNLARRYLSNGETDHSYGINGTAAISGLSFNSIFNSFLASNKKLLILAEGVATNDFILFVLDSTGKPDLNFNSIGHFSMHTDSNRYWMQFVTASPDLTHYFITGTYTENGSNLLDIIEINSEGKIDSAFGVNGEIRMPVLGNDQGRYITFLPDNSMLVGGSGNPLDKKYFGYGTDIFILKFLPTIATSTITLPQPDNKFILVYPTPLHDHATVQFDSPKDESVNFVLLNEEGRAVANWNDLIVHRGENSIALPFNEALSNGWYTLQLNGNGFSESVRVIKQ